MVVFSPLSNHEISISMLVSVDEICLESGEYAFSMTTNKVCSKHPLCDFNFIFFVFVFHHL
jgi:hypothetical protein